MYKKRSVIFDCNFVYFVIMSLFVAVRLLSSTFTIDTVLGYVLNVFIQVGIIFSLSLFLFSYLRKQKVKKTMFDFGFKKVSAKTIILSFVMGVLVYVITIFIASFFSVVLKGLGYESSSTSTTTDFPLWLLFLEIFTSAILPGFCEEVANRGMVVSSYKCLGIKKTVLISGLLFGLMHLNINQFFYATILGFYFGFVALSTDSIYPTMIMHFTNNAISTFMSYAIVNDLPIGSVLDNALSKISANGFAMAMLILFVFIVFIVALLIWLTKIIIKESQIKRIAQAADKAIKKRLRDELMYGTTQDSTIQTENMAIEINPERSDGKRLVSINFFPETLMLMPSYKATQKDMIFLYASLFLGIILTVSTFIWGIL